MGWSHLPLVCPAALATDVFLPILVEPPLSTPTAFLASVAGSIGGKPFRTSFKIDPFPLREPSPPPPTTTTASKNQTTPRKPGGAPGGTQTPLHHTTTTPSRTTTNQNTPIRPNQNAPTTTTKGANQPTALTPGSNTGKSGGGGGGRSPADFYCKLCKKKFSNEATYRGHESSSKHQKEVKAQAAQLAAAAKQSQSRAATPQKPSTPLKAGPHQAASRETDEALAEALLHKQQARQAEGSDILMAIQLYWRAGTVFAQKSHTRDTVECLDRLLRLADVEGPNTKIPSHVLHEARLLLARSLYHLDPPMAGEYFCAALARYFPLPRLAELEDVWDDMPALLKQCRIQYESLVARIGQKASSQEGMEQRVLLHRAVQDLLLETYGCLARAGPSPALVLLAAIHCAAESVHTDWATTLDTTNPRANTAANMISSHLRLGRVYRLMEGEWWCVDCAVSAFNKLAESGAPSIKGDNGADVDDVIGALADAFSLALAAGDEVRCRRLGRVVSKNQPMIRGPRANECFLLADLAGAFCRGDWQWMESNTQRVNAWGPAGVRDVYELCAKRAVCW